MSVLLHLSDPHFGTEQAPVVEALLAFAQAQAPDLVILSGDITQRARAHQFRAARAFVDRLAPCAVLVIPGNHDIPLFNVAARVFAPYKGFRAAFGAELEPSHEAGDLLVVGLKTTRRWRHSDGEVSARQVARSARRFDSARAAQLRIAVVHQPVAVTESSDEENLLHGRDVAVRRWAEAGCDLVLGGHIHLPFVVDLRTRFAGLARPVWAVQAGTALSSRVRGGVPNSVNVIRHDAAAGPRQCTIERWDCAPAAGRFVLERSVRLALGADADADADADTDVDADGA